MTTEEVLKSQEVKRNMFKVIDGGKDQTTWTTVIWDCTLAIFSVFHASYADRLQSNEMI